MWNLTSGISKKDLVVAMLKYAEGTSYSGRFMYGAHCVGIIADSIPEAFAQASDAIFELLTEKGIYDISEYNYILKLILEDARIDNMGTGYIVYWPSLNIPSPVDPDYVEAPEEPEKPDEIERTSEEEKVDEK
ncbi:MAG: hypothetical protein QXP88_00680 [Thermoproteota archaeon]